MQVVAALLLLREISRIFESGSMGFEGSQRPLGPFLEAIWPPVLAVALAAVEAPRSQLSYYRSDTGCMRARMRVKERNEP